VPRDRLVSNFNWSLDPRSPIKVLLTMAKGKAAEKGNEKGGAAAKGKAKGKTDGEEKAGKVKGAQSVNVRHILVGLSVMLTTINMEDRGPRLMMSSARSMQRRKRLWPN
jgi:hypothetical protein